uniref:J domain-containing protein n=1 Tax=Kalanchoe fedtschenkoi TaxID=63787 RepID=A0A7N1A7C9_KALFE
MPSTLLPYLNSTISVLPNPIRFTTVKLPSNSKTHHLPSTSCRASSSSSSSITDLDLYDLLGVDSSSDHSQIKKAYRSLQKRCHPDIAGPAGHEMAIILNDVYSLLSDPIARLAYDKGQAKASDLKGYTGKPLYSVWMGSETEQRAVFVDEVKCVGCLKCALFADKTFAIESVYGRARVVAQWADPEHKILEAIQTCPVDCISMVERSNLAALEFLMSKQPRGTVSMSSGNAVGARVSNIFVDMTKFQNKYKQSMDKASTNDSKEADLRRQARMTAVQAIRSISNWLYWQTPRAGTEASSLDLTHVARRKLSEPELDKLREAVRARKRAKDFKTADKQAPSTEALQEEYWIPSSLALPSYSEPKSPEDLPPAEGSPAAKASEGPSKGRVQYKARPRKHHLVKSLIPFGAGLAAAFYVRTQVGESELARLDQHVAGSLVLDIVNSFWLQTVLAGVTWYCIGLYVIELAKALGRRDEGSGN